MVGKSKILVFRVLRINYFCNKPMSNLCSWVIHLVSVRGRKVCIVLRVQSSSHFYSRLGEYLSRVFDDSSDLDKTPDQVKVMHIVHACELALDVREKDQGRRRSMMS